MQEASFSLVLTKSNLLLCANQLILHLFLHVLIKVSHILVVGPMQSSAAVTAGLAACKG